MKTEELIEIIHNYKSKHGANSYEDFLCLEICRFLGEHKENAFNRNNPKGHLTAGGIVVCGDWVLMNHHKILNKWIGFGGHFENDETNPFITASREVKEECGINGLRSNGVILDIDKFTFKHDKMPAHVHYDIRYLFVAPNKNVSKSNESCELVWLPLEHAIGYSTDNAVKKILGKYKRLLDSKKKKTSIEELVK